MPGKRRDSPGDPWETMERQATVMEAFTRWEEAEWRGEARRHAG